MSGEMPVFKTQNRNPLLPALHFQFSNLNPLIATSDFPPDVSVLFVRGAERRRRPLGVFISFICFSLFLSFFFFLIFLSFAVVQPK